MADNNSCGLEAQIQLLTKQNENLIRIMRERVNQKRGLRPKKEHSGYVLLQCSQWVERYTEDVWDDDISPDDYSSDEQRQYAVQTGLLRYEVREADCWRSVMQTPYDADLPYAYIYHIIEDELRKSILASFGCATMTDISGSYQMAMSEIANDPVSILYRWQYTANYRAGLWELQLFTTDELKAEK